MNQPRRPARLAVACLTTVALALAAGRAAAQPASELSDDRPVDPIVAALLETNPQTPEELLRVTDILIDLREPALARPLVDRLTAATLDESQLADLGRKFGTGLLVKISAAPELGPAASQFADAVAAAMVSQARDPARLASLIDELNRPDRRAQVAAIARLAEGRDAAALALTEVLAEPARSDRFDGVRAALAALGDDALDVLASALESSDAALAEQAVLALQQIRRPQAALLLYAPALAADSPPPVRQAARDGLLALEGALADLPSAAARLYNQSRFLLDAPPKPTTATETVYAWDAAAARITPHQAPAPLAAVWRSLSLARAARRLAPESNQIRRLYLTALLKRDLLAATADNPPSREPGSAWAEVFAAGADVVEDLLDSALEHDRRDVAIATAEMLAGLATSARLQTPDGRPSVLVRAARHPDAQVRFAAVAAILALEPEGPYPGSSYVTQALGHFLRGQGSRRLLVGALSAAEGRRLASLALPMGLEPDVVRDSRSLLELAASSPDVELILLDMHLAAATSGQLLEQLRRDIRTRLIPIGIVAPPESWSRAQVLARRHEATEALVPPVDPPGLELQVNRLLAMSPAVAGQAELRRLHAEQALRWVDAMTGSPRRAHHLRTLEQQLAAAAWSPALGQQAVPILARLGTPAAQRMLVDLASLAAQPMPLRQQAAEAFADNVARHGILLTTAEILLQYDRYNASETQDKPTQQLLGRLLDTLEARTAPPAEPLPATHEQTAR